MSFHGLESDFVKVYKVSNAFGIWFPWILSGGKMIRNNYLTQVVTLKKGFLKIKNIHFKSFLNTLHAFLRRTDLDLYERTKVYRYFC